MNIPSGVATCLYAGILSKINFLKNCHRQLSQPVIDAYLTEITEALAFYKVECVLSFVHLEFQYAELADVIRDWKGGDM